MSSSSSSFATGGATDPAYVSADVAASGAPDAEGTEQRDPAEGHRHAGPVGQEVVTTAAVGRVERVERQVLIDGVGVDQPEKPDQQILDQEDPDQRSDERGDLAVHGRADRDAQKGPEHDGEELLTGARQELCVADLQLRIDDRQPRDRDRGENDEREEREPDRDDHRSDRFGQEDALAVGLDEERGRHGPVSKLVRDDRDPENDREEHGEPDGVDQAELEVERASVLVFRRPDLAGGADPGQKHDHDQIRPPRADRADLEQLRANECAHCVVSPPVSSRKTSSRVARSIESSCSTMLFAAASSPIRSGGRSATSVVSSSSVTVAPCAASSERSRDASGLRTRVPPCAPASTSAIDACWMSLPRWMITTRSTVCATSASTWLETRIVRPSAASERRRSRSQRTPAGSRPFAGSSSTSTSGSPSSAVARPSRWRMPSE